MKHYKLILSLLLLTFLLPSTAEKNQSIALLNTAPLIFTSQQQGYTGTVIHSANSANSASFTSTGPSKARIRGKVVESKITLSTNNTNKKIIVFRWSYAGDMNQRGKATYPKDSKEARLNNLLVGASAYVPASTPAGSYFGEANFQIKNGKILTITPFSIKMVIIATQSIETQRDMNFPIQMSGFTGTVILHANSPESAMFSVTGAPNSAAIAAVIPSVVYLHSNQPSDLIKVYRFTFADETNNINPRTGEFHFPRSTGNSATHAIMVGASAYYRPSLPAGVYTGTATMRITYR